MQDRPTAKINDLPDRDRPISEEYRIVAKEWIDAENAAELLEKLKETVLEQLKTKLMKERGDMADNKAERIVRSEPEWEKYIRDMVAARTKANLCKAKVKYVEMRHREWIAADANARAEMRM